MWDSNRPSQDAPREQSREDSFDVIVIGAGHAGVEAAWAAARLGCSVAICTLSADTVAHMPCNPAVGGTAKGHLVREIDALGGLMGRAIDETGIQFKLLNRSRGPAVWSPRAQADKRVYSEWVERALAGGAEPRVDHRQGGPDPRRTAAGRRPGARRRASATAVAALVVTTGTFLNGLVHVGPEQRPAGRAGRTAVARAGRVAEELWLHVGPAEDGNAAAPVASEHRLLALRRGTRRRSPGPVLVPHRPDRPAADRLSPALHDRPRPRPGSRAHRPVAALQRSDPGDRSAVLPVARRQGDAVSASRAPPDLPRARRAGRRRDLRQRLLDEPAGRRAGRSSSRRCRVSRTR